MSMKVFYNNRLTVENKKESSIIILLKRILYDNACVELVHSIYKY